MPTGRKGAAAPAGGGGSGVGAVRGRAPTPARASGGIARRPSPPSRALEQARAANAGSPGTPPGRSPGPEAREGGESKRLPGALGSALGRGRRLIPPRGPGTRRPVSPAPSSRVRLAAPPPFPGAGKKEKARFFSPIFPGENKKPVTRGVDLIPRQTLGVGKYIIIQTFTITSTNI